MTGPGCAACGFTGRVPLIPGEPMSLVPCTNCSPWTRPESGGAPTTEDFARAAYPAAFAVLGPQAAAAGHPMHATFDELTPEDRERFVELMRGELAAKFSTSKEPV